MSTWLGERVPGEQTNLQKASEILSAFAHSPMIFRIRKTVYGTGIFKVSLHGAQLKALEEELGSVLASQIPAFTNISVKTDEKFHLISFKARISKIKNKH